MLYLLVPRTISDIFSSYYIIMIGRLAPTSLIKLEYLFIYTMSIKLSCLKNGYAGFVLETNY